MILAEPNLCVGRTNTLIHWFLYEGLTCPRQANILILCFLSGCDCGLWERFQLKTVFHTCCRQIQHSFFWKVWRFVATSLAGCHRLIVISWTNLVLRHGKIADKYGTKILLIPLLFWQKIDRVPCAPRCRRAPAACCRLLPPLLLLLTLLTHFAAADTLGGTNYIFKSLKREICVFCRKEMVVHFSLPACRLALSKQRLHQHPCLCHSCKHVDGNDGNVPWYWRRTNCTEFCWEEAVNACVITVVPTNKATICGFTCRRFIIVTSLGTLVVNSKPQFWSNYSVVI